MGHITLGWGDYFREIFVNQIEALAECLEKRLLPTFDRIEDEAKEISEKEFERLGLLGSPYLELDEIAEEAQEAAIEYYHTMDAARQGILNMFAASCYHLFEQQLFMFYRRGLLNPDEEREFNAKLSKRLLRIKTVRDRLLASGIDTGKFASWSMLYDELRLVANVVKHADGWSCQELKSRNPDLFFRAEAGPRIGSVDKKSVYQPLFGEGLYITIEVFRSYTNAVTDFWQELSSAIENQGSVV